MIEGLLARAASIHYNRPMKNPGGRTASALTDAQRAELAQLKSRYAAIIARAAAGNPFDFAQVYPETDDLAALCIQLDGLKADLDSFRPFNPAQAENLRQAWDTQYTYDSNRIEGNSLTFSETSMVINDGLTIAGKPLKDHLEAINHKEAIGFIREHADGIAPFGEATLLKIHGIILHGIDRANAGRYRLANVRVGGSNRVFPNYPRVPERMAEYFQSYDAERVRLHPVSLAAHMHQKLVDIHPFIDGNGRTARLVMNLLLLRAGYPVTIISSERAEREAYYSALRANDSDDDTHPFELLIARNVKHWCLEVLRMISPNGDEQDKHKGYAFFKRIEPFLR